MAAFTASPASAEDGDPRGYRGGRFYHAGEPPAIPGAPAAPASGGVGGAAVIGTDERFEVADTTELPFRLIALLELYDGNDDFIGHCTGTLIGPDSVLTAAHCLYDSETDTFTANIRVVPGKAGQYEPYGSVWAADWWVPDGWIETGGGAAWDWGIIALGNTSLSNAVGGYWFSLAVLLDETLRNEAFFPAVIGYPGDMPYGTMWADFKTAFLEVGPEILTYDIDTAGGESGSAIFSLNLEEDFGLYIAGIHVRGGSENNEGTRIDQFVLDDLDFACKQMFCTFEYVIEEEPEPPAYYVVSSYVCDSFTNCGGDRRLDVGDDAQAFFMLNEIPDVPIRAVATLGSESWQLSWDQPYNSPQFRTGEILENLPEPGSLVITIYAGDEYIGAVSVLVFPQLQYRVIAPYTARD